MFKKDRCQRVDWLTMFCLSAFLSVSVYFVRVKYIVEKAWCIV